MPEDPREDPERRVVIRKQKDEEPKPIDPPNPNLAPVCLPK